MADNDRHIEQADHPQGGHELHDVNPIVITRFGIGLTIIMIATLFVVWGLFSWFVKEEGGRYAAAPPLSTTATSGVRVPPQPRLQNTPRIDLRDIRAAEDQALGTYGWVDQAQGIVRLPVDRAMEIIAQRGLAARTQAPPVTGSQNNPTQSSGGAILQQPGGPLAPELGPASAPPAPSEGSKK